MHFLEESHEVVGIFREPMDLILSDLNRINAANFTPEDLAFVHNMQFWSNPTFSQVDRARHVLQRAEKQRSQRDGSDVARWYIR